MYGRGNYAAPAGRGPPYMPNTPFQQHSPAPQPPFSQSPHPPLPNVFQQGPPPVLPQVGQLGRHVHQHAPPGPPQQGPRNPVLRSGINVQSFFTPAPLPPPPQPLQVQGSSQMQQHPQWTHGTSSVPLTGPPSAPRVLPPPPSQGQTLFGSQIHQAPAGSMQSQTQPACSFYTSPPVGSFEHTKSQLSDAASVGPPPPPLPSSPSLPPSLPPPTSLSTFSRSCMSMPIPAASGSAYNPETRSRLNESSALETSASCPPGGFPTPYLVGDAVRDGDGGSAHGENLISDLPPPPPKPADDRTVHRIEVLCQFIAKNGPEFENMTRQKEFGNAEFKFLFGGESGSEVAVAHEYFLWTKRKYLLGLESVGKQEIDNLSSRPSGGSSSDPNIITDVPYSPADSDMDMEDDITHPDVEPQSCSLHETVSVSNRLHEEQGLQHLLSTAEDSLVKDAADGNFMHPGSQGLGERQGAETYSNQIHIIGKSFTSSDGLDANSCKDVECQLVTSVIETAIPPEDASEPNTPAYLAEIKLAKLPSPLVKQGASPFRLLQDYVSAESSDDEAHLVDAVPATAAPSVKVDNVPIGTNVGVDVGTDHGTKSVLESDKGLAQLPQSFRSQDSSVKPESVMVEVIMPPVPGKSEDFVDNVYANQESLKDRMSQRESRQEVVVRDDGVDSNVKRKENTRSMSSTPMVDKYGRLIREGACDSDSGGSPSYNRRQGKRGRSRSRSRSPHDTRRRRSPRRRKERRGRSRSSSPRRYRSRSRSKSPSFRHADEFGGDKMRRDKGRRLECFDFIEGKCYRGASCRFLHHVDKSDRTRSYRSNHQFKNLPYSSRSDFRGKVEMPHKKSSREHDEGKVQELKTNHDKPDSEEKKDPKEEMDKATSQFHDKSGPSESLVVPIPDANVEKILGDIAQGRHSPSGNSSVSQSQSHFSDQLSLNVGYQLQQMDTSYGSKFSPIHAPASTTSHLPVDKTNLNEIEEESRINSSSMNKTFPSQPAVSTESIPPGADHLSHLPPPFTSVSQDASSSFNQEKPKDHNLILPAAVFPPHSASVENHPPYQASVSYSHSQFPIPPNSSWSSLPPPPSHPPQPPTFVNDRTSIPGHYSGPPAYLMQNMLPPRNDFSSQTSGRPYSTDFPTLLNVGQNQAYPPIQELSRPPDQLVGLHHPMSQAMSQSHEGTGLAGEDRSAGRPGPGLSSPNSFGQDNMHSQTMSFSRESPSKRNQAFPCDNLPPADGTSSLHPDPGILGSTLSSYTSKFLDGNQPSVLSSFGISRISNHFNPYASTFAQPLSSKFSSNQHGPFSCQLGAAYTFNQVPVDERDVASLGSRNLMSTQNSAQPVEGILPRPGDGQYDPLYDSIEPSMNSVRKSNEGQKREVTDESNVIGRFSGSNNSLNEKEHNKLKGGGSDEVSGSLEIEEYGETADGEVGAVENGSPSNLNDATVTAAREVEIDQVKAPGKSKKSKESRSMKLFKVALADFVKEVLKPSWRQGNMSKEAFKTIVKKTVDRVSGAMKSHQIPKSQAKINRYIDSSQRKLTKLVMGYVDKYVKV